MADPTSFTLKLKRVLGACAGIVGSTLLIAQFVPVDRSNPPVTADFDGPPEIRAVLRAKCYDCHSHETTWPWYSWVAPMSWGVSDHVRDGRRELNFSQWGEYSASKQEDKIGEIYDEVFDGYMPLPSYLLIHPETKVTPEELALFERWLDDEL